MAIDDETSIDEETPTGALPTPILNGDQETVLDELRGRRTELEPVGKTIVLEIPGYDGKLAAEYQYIGTEETELISKRVMKETKRFGHRGMTLLSSADLLIAACQRVLIRGAADQDWAPLQPAPVRFDRSLAEAFRLPAEEPREVVMAIFGSEHAVVEQNMKLSNWLTNTTREVDDDFFGLY
jgi:hypothetical protein